MRVVAELEPGMVPTIEAGPVCGREQEERLILSVHSQGPHCRWSDSDIL